MLGAAGAVPASAQSDQSGGVINEIHIEGTQRIEPETVRSYMGINPGDPFDPIRLDKALKNIHSTGLFADVTLRREGDVLIVSVVENPIINRIAFEGNDRLDDEALRSEITLRPRIVFTKTKAQNDAQRLFEIYRRSGRYAATVEPKVIELPQNRVDLVFEINEGPLTNINAINFIGNRVFSDSSLRDEITTRESAFWRFLSTTDTYDPDRLSFDRELLRRFYLREGYADFRVTSVVAELTPDREGFIVTFTLEEGERYTFGAIDVTTTLRDLNPETLQQHILVEEGDWYDAQAIEDTVSNLSEAVGNLGYAFVDIRPRADLDPEARLIGINFEINEGPKVYVERIDIQGNVRTLDKVIRREFRLVEGDAFNSARLRRSRQRIQNLGFFRSVDVESNPGSSADKTIVTVDVEEQSTGSLSFGAGFSTDSGPLANISLSERNLLGRGQDLRLSFTISGADSQVDLSFTEPYFLGRNVAAGFDLFRTTSSLDTQAFDIERIGGSLRAGFSYNENLRQNVRYTLEEKTISEVDADASLLIQGDEGTFLASAISQKLTYDTRDSRLDPREGGIVRLSNSLSGLGGDVRFLKSSLGGAYYYSFLENWTASVDAEVGNIVGITQDTRISDRYFVGGTSCRGFEVAGIGPRDEPTADALGAKQFYTGTLELGFPLGLPEEYDIRGRVFTDVCSAWGLDQSNANVLDEKSPRVSVGFGFSWNSFLGPITIDLGFALVKESFDQTQAFSFSFGTQF